MKRLLSILLAAALLAGCGGRLRLLPEGGQSPDSSAVPEATEAPERVLTVWDEGGALSEALALYAAEQGVRVEQAADAASAALAVSSAEPGADTALDLTQQGELMQGMAGALTGGQEGCHGLPLANAAYGYLASAARLRALLGAEFDPADLQKATADEWRDFLDALNDWLETPAETDLTLNGKEYSLPAERPAELAALEAVFAVAAEDRFAGAVLSPVLGTCYKTVEEAAAGGRTDAELTGALNSLWTLLTDEAASLAGVGENGAAPDRAGARAAFAEGKALFYRASTAESTAAGLSAEDTVVLPLKFTFDDTDLHGGFSLEELLTQPVVKSGGWVYLPAGAEESQRTEACAFLLWLYASETGRQLMGGGGSPEGLPDLSAALSAEALEAIDAAGDELAGLSQFTTAHRKTFTGAVLAALP